MLLKTDVAAEDAIFRRPRDVAVDEAESEASAP